jgi:hypothetical protein
MAGPEYQNIITTDLVDDAMLTDNNIKTFKKAYKELYDFAMVRRDYSFACIRYRVACLNLPLYIERDHALTKEVREAESSREWPPGACCQGKTHIRRADEELLSSERARQAEARAESRDMAPQERFAQSQGTAQGTKEGAPR